MAQIRHTPSASNQLCKHCRDYVPATAVVGGQLVESPHCRNWYGTFPHGCGFFVREPGSDDDLEV